jgi:hypothetical protein
VHPDMLPALRQPRCVRGPCARGVCASVRGPQENSFILFFNKHTLFQRQCMGVEVVRVRGECWTEAGFVDRTECVQLKRPPVVRIFIHSRALAKTRGNPDRGIRGLIDPYLHARNEVLRSVTRAVRLQRSRRSRQCRNASTHRDCSL